MPEPCRYHLTPDPDGGGWLLTAEGHVARSLPIDTLEEALELARELVRQRPGSTLDVGRRPLPLSPAEIEHRSAP